MRFITFLFSIVTAMAIFAYLLQLVPAKTEEQPVIAEPLFTESRVTIQVNEQDYPVNVYTDEVPLSEGWQCYTQDTCRRYGIDYALMLSLMETESSFQADADSGWAYGLCQIGWINQDWLAEEGIDIMTNQGNIEAACLILSDYLERYTTEQALMCYNQGEYGAQEDFDNGIYSTRYSQTVLAGAEKWKGVLRND